MGDETYRITSLSVYIEIDYVIKYKLCHIYLIATEQKRENGRGSI